MNKTHYDIELREFWEKIENGYFPDRELLLSESEEKQILGRLDHSKFSFISEKTISNYCRCNHKKHDEKCLIAGCRCKKFIRKNTTRGRYRS